MVMKGELANETVNYDRKIKAYVSISGRCVSYQKRAALVKSEQVSEAVVHRFSSKQVLVKFLQIAKENACVGDTF